MSAGNSIPFIRERRHFDNEITGIMKKIIRIGLAQVDATVGDLAGNSDRILSFTEKAREEDVDILSFPNLL